MGTSSHRPQKIWRKYKQQYKQEETQARQSCNPQEYPYSVVIICDDGLKIPDVISDATGKQVISR